MPPDLSRRYFAGVPSGSTVPVAGRSSLFAYWTSERTPMRKGSARPCLGILLVSPTARTRTTGARGALAEESEIFSGRGAGSGERRRGGGRGKTGERRGGARVETASATTTPPSRADAFNCGFRGRPARSPFPSPPIPTPDSPRRPLSIIYLKCFSKPHHHRGADARTLRHQAPRGSPTPTSPPSLLRCRRERRGAHHPPPRLVRRPSAGLALVVV